MAAYAAKRNTNMFKTLKLWFLREKVKKSLEEPKTRLRDVKLGLIIDKLWSCLGEVSHCFWLPP
ncbi:MAG: hypothetical protein DRO11_04250 [Methanobacteriota archaeon]|nr:MAG: hypothetical protein DRO11_04250 [Euryarchaeota archaeon]